MCDRTGWSLFQLTPVTNLVPPQGLLKLVSLKKLLQVVSVGNTLRRLKMETGEILLTAFAAS